MKFRFFILFLLSAVAFAPPHRVPRDKWICQTSDDYRTHMRAHIARVGLIGRYIFTRFSDQFPHVQLPILIRLLEGHDTSKVSEALSKNLNVKNWEQLFKYYNKDIDDMQNGERDAMLAFRRYINDIDRNEALRILREAGVTDPLVKDQYLRLDTIADQFDRFYEQFVTPQEFGRTLDEPPSLRLRGDHVLVPIARILEAEGRAKWYVPLTRDATYLRFRYPKNFNLLSRTPMDCIGISVRFFTNLSLPPISP